MAHTTHRQGPTNVLQTARRFRRLMAAFGLCPGLWNIQSYYPFFASETLLDPLKRVSDSRCRKMAAFVGTDFGQLIF